VAARISSAGFGPSGEPAEAEAITVMGELNIDLSGHRSRSLTPDLCRAADLIVVMTRLHLVGVATIEPEAWPRAFPFVDLVARARKIDPLTIDEPFRQWVLRAHGERTRSSVLALPTTVDVADPVGKPLAAYRRRRDQLAELSADLARCLAAGAGHLTTPQSLVSGAIHWDGWDR
jgi:protein-tyrosine-phosphatase